MDKRSLLFIACISLAFFGIQAWFGWQNKPAAVTTESLAQKPLQAALDADHGQSIGIYNSVIPKVRSSDFHDVQMIVKKDADGDNSDEQLFVLENDYQQLVFSTNGGSLAEINLPFKTTSSKSYVKEIEPDRLILAQDPSNARFPMSSATFFDQGEQSGKIGGYYPLLRRSIVKPDGTLIKAADPKYYALACFRENQEPIHFKVTRFEKNLIQFKGNGITKTYTIPEKRNGPYCFELTIEVDADATGLWISSGVPEAELVSGSFSPLLRYQITHGRDSDIETLSPSDKHPVLQDPIVQPNWLSNSNGYFGIIMDPLTKIPPGYRVTKIPGTDIPTRLSVIDMGYKLYPADSYPGYITYLPLQSGTQTFRVFAGPFDDSLLKELDALYEDPTKGYNPEYASAQSIQGWFSFISQPFSKFLDYLLQMFYWISRSWGFSIILLTIALRVMMYPLNNWSIKSSIKMQDLAPKVQAIQERFKKDPKKGQVEIMNLYRSQGVNPFGGCLPILLQMPFLFGMFYLLKSSFPLRGASFVPGWIDNLAAPDVIFSWSYPIPLIGTEFHLLPIIGALAMYWQQKMTSKLPKDSSQLSDSQKQQKMMGNIMLVVGVVMFYSLPSGLNIYFLSSTLLGLLQQWFLTKKMKRITPTLTVRK